MFALGMSEPPRPHEHETAPVKTTDALTYPIAYSAAIRTSGAAALMSGVT